jgi:hypothetical protein
MLLVRKVLLSPRPAWPSKCRYESIPSLCSLLYQSFRLRRLSENVVGYHLKSWLLTRNHSFWYQSWDLLSAFGQIDYFRSFKSMVWVLWLALLLEVFVGSVAWDLGGLAFLWCLNRKHPAPQLSNETWAHSQTTNRSHLMQSEKETILSWLNPQNE